MSVFEELKDRCAGMKGFLAAAYTDKYEIGCWPQDETELDEDKLLEIRVFNQDREVKFFRADLSKEFRMREIDDTVSGIQNGRDYTEYMDECQYLDIDTVRSEKRFAESHEVITTGGGRFFLPAENMKDAKVIIRSYFEKDSKFGQARIFDWRVVGFMEGK